MKRLFALAALALVLSNTGANAAYANRAECEEVFPQSNGSRTPGIATKNKRS